MHAFTKGIICEERKKNEISYNKNVLVCAHNECVCESRKVKRENHENKYVPVGDTLPQQVRSYNAYG